MLAWRNSPDVYRGLIHRSPISEAAQEVWFARTAQMEQERRELWLIIEEAGGKAIGTTFLTDIDLRNANAQWGIFIGESDFRGRGHAGEAAIRMIDHAFDHLNLRRVWCRVIEGNDPALGLYDRLGFQQEGVLREHLFLDGAYRGMSILGLLKEDYMAARDAALERTRRKAGSETAQRDG